MANLSIYTKRIDDVSLAIVHYNGPLVRVLMKQGKRVDFTDWKSAQKKVWHVNQAGVQGFEWSQYMTKAEFQKRIDERLNKALTVALETSTPKFGDPDFDIDSAVEADMDAQFERAFGDTKPANQEEVPF